MPGGKAYGTSRDYQATCLTILQMLSADRKLQPYEGDGIDVTIRGPYASTITFDVILEDGAGALLVAECRKRTAAVKQADLFAFAFEIEKIREFTGRSVAGIFCTKSRFQRGAVLHAALQGIQMLECCEGQPKPDFGVVYRRYDPERKRILQHIHEHGVVRAGSFVSCHDSYRKGDGSVE